MPPRSDRPIRRRVRHLPARQGRLGREHGLHHRHGEFVRRPLVRREVDPQFDSPEWKETLDTYLKVMKESGPPGAVSNGFNENLALFNSGKCAMWIDATVAAGFVTDPKRIQGRRQGRLRLGSEQGIGQERQLAVGVVARRSRRVEQGRSRREVHRLGDEQQYAELVASKEGWAHVPPGTRKSLYDNPKYQEAAPFAKLTLESINTSDPTKPTVKPVPYVGVQFVAIPEFQGLGTKVGQFFSAALAGSTTAEQALASAQKTVTRDMKRAGYQGRRQSADRQ